MIIIKVVLLYLIFTSAPDSSRSFTISSRPWLTANMSAVCPCWLALMFTSDMLNNRRTTDRWVSFLIYNNKNQSLYKFEYFLFFLYNLFQSLEKLIHSWQYLCQRDEHTASVSSFVQDVWVGNLGIQQDWYHVKVSVGNRVVKCCVTVYINHANHLDLQIRV